MVHEYFPVLKMRADQRAGALSGGEQQMLAISRALMARPKMMLLDEPSLGLAPKLVKEIFEIIVRINREQGVTVLLVEQNANIALHTADYGYVLEVGRIVMEDTCARLLEKEDIKEFYLGDEGAERAGDAAVEAEEDVALAAHGPALAAPRPAGPDAAIGERRARAARVTSVGCERPSVRLEVGFGRPQKTRFPQGSAPRPGRARRLANSDSGRPAPRQWGVGWFGGRAIAPCRLR